MSARDDFGSTAGTSSSYKGGAGGLGNGGVGGGMGGGASGGGAGINGGAGSATGLRTNANMTGNTAFGNPGGSALGYAMMDPSSMARMGMGPTNETYSGFTNPDGSAMYPGMGGSFTAPNAASANAAAAAQYARRSAAPSSMAAPSAQPASLPIPVRPPTPVPIPSWRPIPASYKYMFGRNPTSYPAWSSGYHQPGNFPGALPDAQAALHARYSGPSNLSVGSSKIQDRAPTDNSFGGNGFDHTTGHVSGPGANDGWGASGTRSGGYGSGSASFGY